MEIEAKPDEAQAPPVVVPDEVRDDGAAARTAPNSPSEHQDILPPFLGNGALMLKETFGMVLTGVAVFAHGLGTLHHHVALDIRFVLLQEWGKTERRFTHELGVLDQSPTGFVPVILEAGWGFQGHSGFRCGHFHPSFTFCLR